MGTKLIKLFVIGIILLVGVSSTAYSQATVAPKITEISERNQFVMVLRGSEKSNRPERVFTADALKGEDFDPEKLSSYPTWSIDRVTVNRGANVKPLQYFTIFSVDKQKYYCHSCKENKFLTKKEYDKYYEKDEAGKYKYTVEDMYHLIYAIYTLEDKYIKLGVPNKTGSTGVSNSNWQTREFKLVLVK